MYENQMVMMKQMWMRLSVFFLIFGAISCSQRSKTLKKVPIPGPEAAESAVSRIDSLLGYAFSWKFNRKQVGMMPKMSAELEGKVCVPDRIYLRGTWKNGEVTEKLDHYSIEGREFTFNETSHSWKRGSTGSFLDPHEHLKLVLSFGEFSFEEFDAHRREDCYVFSFKPNVYFLDPIETSEPQGKVWVSITRGIPLRIQVTAKGRLLSWDMELSGINSFGDLTVPFERITFSVPDIANEEDIATIVGRFLYLGYEEPAVQRDEGGAVFSVSAEFLSDTLIESMLKQGSVEILLGVWPAHPIYVLREDTCLLHEQYGMEARLLFEQGVVTKPIISVARVLTDDAFGAYELRNDLLGEFSLYAVVANDARDTLSSIVTKMKDEPVVALVDGAPMLISNIRDAWLVEQQIPLAKGLQGKEAVRLFARLKGTPLSKNYTFTRIEKEE
jgi:hypothetical protein